MQSGAGMDAAKEQAIIVASVTSQKGETGMHTHIREVMLALNGMNRRTETVTPYDAPAWQVYPLFSPRKLLDLVSSEASVRWYCHWHERMLHKALGPLLQKQSAALVYAQCPLSARAALTARRNSSQVIIMAVHFNLSEAEEWVEKGMIARGGTAERAMLALDRDVLPRLDGLIFVSEYMRAQLLARIPQIAHVPHIVLPNFMSDPGPCNVKDGRRELINIGTFEPRKNQSYLLEIIAAAKMQGMPLHLTLVGDGPDRASLERKVELLGIRELVHFAGYVTHGARLLSDHKAYIHSALIENLPFTVIEALAHGLPVFAPAVGGIPEMFQDGLEGRMLPLDDASLAAHRVSEWFAHPARLSAASSAARQCFLKNFNTEKVASRLVRFFDEVTSPYTSFPFAEDPIVPQADLLAFRPRKISPERGIRLGK